MIFHILIRRKLNIKITLAKTTWGSVCFHYLETFTNLAKFLTDEGIKRVESGLVERTVHEDMDDFGFLGVFEAEFHDALERIVVVLERYTSSIKKTEFAGLPNTILYFLQTNNK